MPTYDYRCQFCHEHTEAFQKMSDAPLVTCPHCGKEGLQRVVTGGAGVIYKGEGWYVTDYSKKSSGGKDEPKKETKTETKKEGTDAAPAAKPEAPKASETKSSAPSSTE
jgi:putative FmdB family regulatory protein